MTVVLRQKKGTNNRHVETSSETKGAETPNLDSVENFACEHLRDLNVAETQESEVSNPCGNVKHAGPTSCQE